MSEEQHDTREMRAVQAQRLAEEQEMADVSTDSEEAAQHQRRAEKAQYLREKLEERAESEREVAREYDGSDESEGGDR